MKYLFILIFIAVYGLFSIDLGYAAGSPLYTHFTYMFQHAGIFHLVLNSVAFFSVFNSLQRFLNTWFIMASIFISALGASFFAVYDKPTVGASSMIYTMIGMYIGVTLFRKDIKIADIRKYLLFIVTILLGLVISYFKNDSNFFLHVYTCVAGLGLSGMHSWIIRQKS